MKGRTLAILALVNTVYIIIGGVVFHFLESTNEEDTRVDIKGFLAEFMRNNSCLSEEDLHRLIDRVMSAYDSGIIAQQSNASQPSNWDVASAISFSTTVVTTIGYGYITPSTTGGRAFCIVYALIGIPLCLTMLAVLGSKLSSAAESVTSKLQRKLSSSSSGARKTLFNRWHGWGFIVLVGIIVFVLVPSAVVSIVEDWTYFEGVYFSVITLTTIGFGDYVLASDYDSSGRSAYKIVSTLWIMFGLAWCATCIATTQDKFTTVFITQSPDGSNSSPEEELKSAKCETPPTEEKPQLDADVGVETDYDPQSLVIHRTHL